MKELHLTSESKIHTTCVYKATHYRWMPWQSQLMEHPYALLAFVRWWNRMQCLIS